MAGRAANHKDHRNWPLKTTVPRRASSKRACNDVAVRTSLASPLQQRPEHRDDDRDGADGQRRLLVVSHPAVVSVNQEVYRELARRGWEVTIVLPDRWRHEYSDVDVVPQALEGMESALRPTRVALRGRPQRHFYLTNCAARCVEARPDVAFIEAEPFSLPAAQWGFALRRLGVPFGVQSYENIDRHLPLPVRWLRSRVLRDAAFVAARSDSAAQLARAWGAKGEVALAPPAVPAWDSLASSPTATDRPFTVGYAGRLVESKGLTDLLAAVRQLTAPVELLLIGDGEMRQSSTGSRSPARRYAS